MRLLQQRGVPTYITDHTGLQPIVRTARFDSAVLTFWELAEQLLPVIRQASPGTAIVVDSVDLHFVRKARSGCACTIDAPPTRLTDGYGSEVMRQINTYVAADGASTVSRKERDLINDLRIGSCLATGRHSARTCPVSPVLFKVGGVSRSSATSGHQPNVAAVEYLCHEVRPKIPPEILIDSI